MPSTTQCALNPSERCNNRNVQTYFKNSLTPLPLCRQCATNVGVNLIVSSCMLGGDVEQMFKDIMTKLAEERRLEEARKERAG